MRWQLGTYVSLSLHFWGVELGNQMRGVSTRLRMTLWGEGQESTRTWKASAYLGSARGGPWLVPWSWPCDCVNRCVSRKIRVPEWTPEKNASFPSEGCKPLLIPKHYNRWVCDNRLVIWATIWFPLPPECTLPEGWARVCTGGLMVMFPVSHSMHSVNITQGNKYVTSRGLEVKKFLFIQITPPPLSVSES